MGWKCAPPTPQAERKYFMSEVVAGLKPRQRKFATLLSMGVTPGDAYRRTHFVRGLRTDVIETRAHALAIRPALKQYASYIVGELKVSDLDSAGACVRD